MMHPHYTPREIARAERRARRIVAASLAFACVGLAVALVPFLTAQGHTGAAAALVALAAGGVTAAYRLWAA